MRPVMVGIIVLISILFTAGFLSSQEKEEVRSLVDDRRDILLYGIESEVLDVIQALEEEKDDSLVREAFWVFESSGSPALKRSMLAYFTTVDYRVPEETVIALLQDYEELHESVLLAAVTYLSAGDNPAALETYRIMLDSVSPVVQRSAVQALGTKGTPDDAVILRGLLEDIDFPVSLKPDIILGLGDLKDPESRTILSKIILDEYEEPTWRRYALISLGKIGFTEDVEIVKQAYLNETDAITRSYAVSALEYFDTPEAEDLLIQSLRDTFWRTRVNAAKALGERRSSAAVDILIYKAGRDPEKNVKVAAVTALGEIGNPRGFDLLRELYSNELSNIEVRSAAFDALASRDLEQSIPAFEKVIAFHWDKQGSKVLEFTAKRLSSAESTVLRDIFLRFMSHPEMNIVIHGIRGAKRNGFSSLSERIEELAGEGSPRSVRREALAALEELE